MELLSEIFEECSIGREVQIITHSPYLTNSPDLSMSYTCGTLAETPANALCCGHFTASGAPRWDNYAACARGTVHTYVYSIPHLIGWFTFMNYTYLPPLGMHYTEAHDGWHLHIPRHTYLLHTHTWNWSAKPIPYLRMHKYICEFQFTNLAWANKLLVRALSIKWQQYHFENCIYT